MEGEGKEERGRGGKGVEGGGEEVKGEEWGAKEGRNHLSSLQQLRDFFFFYSP